MSSKGVGGFNLVLGALYEDRWYNRAMIEHNSAKCCPKCNAALTIHRLEKFVFAFGKVIEKACDAYTCPICLNESVVFYDLAPKKKTSKRNLNKLFAKLPLAVQQQILGGK